MRAGRADPTRSGVVGDHEDFPRGFAAERDVGVAIEEAEDEGSRLGAVLDDLTGRMEVEAAINLAPVARARSAIRVPPSTFCCSVSSASV